MATWQAYNVLTGTIEGPKYIEVGVAAVLWRAALTTSFTVGDTILGPSVPAGVFIDNFAVDVDQLDTGAGMLFTVGTVASPALFISSTNLGQTGGILGANVAGTLGSTFSATTQVIATITHAATTPKAGNFRFKLTYTASP